MMRLTFVCLLCRKTARRVMPNGKGAQPEGGCPKCPKGHGLMVRADGRSVFSPMKEKLYADRDARKSSNATPMRPGIAAPTVKP